MAVDPQADPIERPARTFNSDTGGTLSQSYGNGYDAGPAYPIPSGTRTASFSTSSFFDLLNVAFVGWPGITFNLGHLDYSCFHRADLTGAQIMGNCTAYYCDFSFAWLNDVTWEFVFATGSDFTGANMNGCHCGPTRLGTIAEGIVCSFDFCDFTDAVLTNCDFTGCEFRRSCFIGADLTGSILDQATFANVTYDDTTKWPAGFNTARCTGALKKYADYSGQTLSGVDFTGGGDFSAALFLGHANFRGTILENCQLSMCMRADFTDAQFQNGTLSGNAYLGSGIQQMTHAILKGATLDLSADYSETVGGNMAFADLTGATVGFFVDDPPPTSIGWGFSAMNLSHAKLVGLKRHGIQLIFQDCNLSCADLTSASLTSVIPDYREVGSGFGYYNLDFIQNGTSNYSYAVLDFTIGGWYTSDMIAHASFKKAVLNHTSFTGASIVATDFTGAGATTACFDGTVDSITLFQGPAFKSVRPGDTSVFPPGVDATVMTAMLEGRIERTSSIDLVWTAHSDVAGQQVQMTFEAANILLTLSECVNMRLLGDEDPGPDADTMSCSNLVNMSWDGQAFDQFDCGISNYGLPTPTPVYGPLSVGTNTTRAATKNRQRTVNAENSGTVLTGS